MFFLAKGLRLGAKAGRQGVPWVDPRVRAIRVRPRGRKRCAASALRRRNLRVSFDDTYAAAPLSKLESYEYNKVAAEINTASMSSQ